MSDETNSSVKLPVFDGEAKKYQSWWIRFQAYSRVKGFNVALRKSADLPVKEEDVDALDASNVNEKKKIVAVKKNALAMAHITMALGSESLLNKVNTVSSDEWPGGLAYKLIESLKEEYQPEDRVATVEMKRQMSKVKMRKYEKPSKLIEQIMMIENQFSGHAKKLDEEDKIAMVLEKAPKDYASVLTVME